MKKSNQFLCLLSVTVISAFAFAGSPPPNISKTEALESLEKLEVKPIATDIAKSITSKNLGYIKSVDVAHYLPDRPGKPEVMIAENEEKKSDTSCPDEQAKDQIDEGLVKKSGELVNQTHS